MSIHGLLKLVLRHKRDSFNTSTDSQTKISGKINHSGDICSTIRVAFQKACSLMYSMYVDNLCKDQWTLLLLYVIAKQLLLIIPSTAILLIAP